MNRSKSFFHERILSLPRFFKILIVVSVDFLIFLSSSILTIVIVKAELRSLEIIDFIGLFTNSIIILSIFFLMGVYRSLVRFIDIFGLIKISVGIIFAATVSLIFSSIPLLVSTQFSKFWELTLSEILIFSSFSLILVLASRLAAHSFFSSRRKAKRIVIYGAGAAGIQLAGALKLSNEMNPVYFIDDDKNLQGNYIGNMRVLSPQKLRRLINKGRIDEVLIAIPSASRHRLKSLLKQIEGFSVRVRVLPGVSDLAQGKISVNELKEIELQDLLERSEVEPSSTLVQKNIADKSVLITGAGGSIGSEISRQVAKRNPSQLILLDSNEYALFSIKNELEKLELDFNVFAVLANVTDKERVIDVLSYFHVNTVYHAAAYKHVSIVEENPFEAVRNNIYGTKICAESAIKCNVDTFVLISTDKAVRPTNIMGATKRFAELILQSLNATTNTRLTMVRFGNVIGSSGSAIPLFQKQILDGGPVTVTHPDVTRYFMSIPEAAELVIQAGAMGEGGDVFVLDMGEPLKILKLAHRLIELSGMELKTSKNPGGDIEIEFTGLRPGEKLYEELLIGDKVTKTEHEKILKAQEEFFSIEVIDELLLKIKSAEKDGNTELLKELLKEAVTEFTPETNTVDIIYKQKQKSEI